MQVDVHALEPARLEDFDRLFDAEPGPRWCRCVAWWVPTWDGFGERTAEENLALRRELFARGELDGYLAYATDRPTDRPGGRPVGWCQVGPRDRLEKLVRSFALEPDASTFAVTCFVVAEGVRRRGVARALLRAVLEDAPRRGATRIEAYPKTGADLDVCELWNGPEALFLEHGFERLRAVPPRVILTRDLRDDRIGAASAS